MQKNPSTILEAVHRYNRIILSYPWSALFCVPLWCPYVTHQQNALHIHKSLFELGFTRQYGKSRQSAVIVFFTAKKCGYRRLLTAKISGNLQFPRLSPPNDYRGKISFYSKSHASLKVFSQNDFRDLSSNFVIFYTYQTIR